MRMAVVIVLFKILFIMNGDFSVDAMIERYKCLSTCYAGNHLNLIIQQFH